MSVQEALEFLDPRVDALFQQSPFSTQIFAPDGTSIAANPSWERLWGVTHEAIAGYNILHDPQLAERGVLPYIRKAFDGKASAVPAIKYVPDETIPGKSDVAYRWVRAYIYPVFNSDGTLREVVLIHEDVTEQHDIEQALRESEERFRAQYQGIPLPTYTWQARGDDWVLVDFNRAAEEFTGGRIRLSRGVSARDFLGYEPVILKDFERCMRERRGFRSEMQHRMASTGDTRDLVVYYGFAPPDMVMVHTEDVTDRLAAQRALAERARIEAEWDTTLAQLIDGVAVADREGTITFVNEAGARMIGREAGALQMAQIRDALDLSMLDGTPYRHEELPLLRAAVHGEIVRGVDVLLRRPDGSRVILQVNATPVLGHDGTHLGGVSTFRDVTAEREMNRQKDEFLSAAAHDLRTPLTLISGLTQVLQRQAAKGSSFDSERFLERLEVIQRAARRMTGLVNELLDATRLEMGRPLSLQHRRVDIVAILTDVVTEARRATHAAIVLETDVPELNGEWDPERLYRVFANLLSNACKYGGGNEISVRLWGEEDRAVVSIQDRGIGIPERDLPRIFDRFYRASNVSNDIPGTGIGLEGVRRIVEAHGGSIAVESQEHQGTTMIVSLPYRPVEVSDAAASP